MSGPSALSPHREVFVSVFVFIELRAIYKDLFHVSGSNKFLVATLGVMLMRNAGSVMSTSIVFIWHLVAGAHTELASMCEPALLISVAAYLQFETKWLNRTWYGKRKVMSGWLLFLITDFLCLFKDIVAAASFFRVCYWDSRNETRRGTFDTRGRCLNQPSGFFFSLSVPPRKYQHCTQQLKLQDKNEGLYGFWGTFTKKLFSPCLIMIIGS